MATQGKISDSPGQKLSKSLSDLDSSKSPTFNKKSPVPVPLYVNSTRAPEDDCGIYHSALSIQDTASTRPDTQQDSPTQQDRGASEGSAPNCGTDDNGYTPMTREASSEPDDPVYDEIDKTVELTGPSPASNSDRSATAGSISAQTEAAVEPPQRIQPTLSLRPAIHAASPSITELAADSLDDKESSKKAGIQLNEEYDAVNTKSTSCKSTISKKTCCVLVSMLVMAMVACGALAFSAFMYVNDKAEIAALQAQLNQIAALQAQLNQTRLPPLTEADWSRLQGIIDEGVRNAVDRGLTPLERLDNSLAVLVNRVNVLEEKQITNTMDVIQHGERLAELGRIGESFQNETTRTFAQISEQVVERQRQIDLLREELNSTRTEITTLASLQNQTQRNMAEFNHTLVDLGDQVKDLGEKMNTITIDFKKHEERLVKLENASESFQNKTTISLAQISEQLTAKQGQIELLQDELNSTGVQVTVLSSMQNQTQGQVDVLSQQVEQMEHKQNQTQRDLDSLSSKVGQFETEIRTEVAQLRSELSEAQTTLVGQFNSLRDSLDAQLTEEVSTLQTALNATETRLSLKLETLSNVTQQDITMLTGRLGETKQVLLNLTHDVRTEFTGELVKTRDDLNALRDNLTTHLYTVNSTLLDISSELQDRLTNLSIDLDVHNANNIHEIGVINSTFTELIIHNRIDIRELADDLNKTDMQVRRDLDQLSQVTRHNFTVLAEALGLARDVSLEFTEKVQTELQQEVNKTRANMEVLRGDVTTQVNALTSSIDGLGHELSVQIGANNEAIESLATEAQLNHTSLSRVVAENHQALSADLSNKHNQLNQNIGLITDRADSLEESIHQDISTLQQDINGIKSRTNILEIRTSGDLSRLENKVNRFHPNAATILLPNAVVYVISVVITLCLVIG